MTCLLSAGSSCDSLAQALLANSRNEVHTLTNWLSSVNVSKHDRFILCRAPTLETIDSVHRSSSTSVTCPWFFCSLNAFVHQARTCCCLIHTLPCCRTYCLWSCLGTIDWCRHKPRSVQIYGSNIWTYVVCSLQYLSGRFCRKPSELWSILW